MEDRTKWLEERRQGIGGSDVAAILGLSPWKTPYQLYQEKRGEIEDFSGTDRTDWGSRLEPTIRQWYADTTGRIVLVPDRIIKSPQHPYMQASLDGLTECGRIVEIKTARTGHDWGEPGTDAIPEYYLTQVHHYLAVTGLQVADVPVSIAGAPPVLYQITKDNQLEDLIIEAEARFWQRVLDGNPPEAVTYADAVRRFGKSAATGIVVADSDLSRVVSDLKKIQTKIETLKQAESDLKTRIIASLGEAGDTLASPEGKILCTYRLAKGRRTFDVEGFKQQHPKLYVRHVKDGEPSRRFLLK